MPSLDEIISLAKRRGFVYPTSQIYSGLASSYDYGPNGAELMRNIKNLFWQYFIDQRDDIIALDSQIILKSDTWVASGHTSSFCDPLVEDLKTHKRFRADHLISQWILDHPDFKNPPVVEDMTIDEMASFISANHLLSPDGNQLTAPKQFNLLFETEIGAVSGDKSKVYLRGETAQGIFTNFKQILDSNRVQLPFGVAQIGKSFRNEITTGQFIFRTLEFEQAEIEYFFDPSKTNWQELLESFKQSMWDFVTKVIGLSAENLRWRRHTDTERSHYSLDTYDLEYRYPFGFKELWGIAYRTDYDLKQHAQHSNADLTYFDQETKTRFIPHVIEPALGINRLFLAILSDAFEVGKNPDRTYLKLSPNLSPKLVAVFPLVKNKDELTQKAKTIYYKLKQLNIKATWDDRGNIGKRYLSQDEVGTKWCATIDYQTLEDDTITLRDRDTTTQIRLDLDSLIKKLKT